MADPNIETLKKESYLKAIENSVGSRTFNSLFVRFKDSGKVADVLNDGEYSCAFFVSNILFLFQAVSRSMATVKSLKEFIVENKENRPWRKVLPDEIEPGDIIFWEKVKHEDGTETAHVGFALNKEEAVSTSSKEKAVARHPINYRIVDCVYRYVFA